MLLILDTSTIVTYLKTTGNSPMEEIVKLAKKGQLDLGISIDTLTELKETITQEKIKAGLPQPQKSAKFIAWYQYNAKKFDPREKVEICRDPTDNKFLELAADCQADYLLSLDNDLLELGNFHSTIICKPKEFLK